jgi:hypothetical protein
LAVRWFDGNQMAERVASRKGEALRGELPFAR